MIYVVIWGIISLVSLLPINREWLALIQVWAVFVASVCAIQFTSEWFKDVNKDLTYIGFLVFVNALMLLLLCFYYFYTSNIKEIQVKDRLDFYVMLAQLIFTYIGARYGYSKRA